MLQALSLGALAWYVRGACRTGKEARVDITTAQPDPTTGRWDHFLACHPPLGNRSQLYLSLNVVCGMNALDPHQESSWAKSPGKKNVDLRTHDKVAGLSSQVPILQMGKPEIQKSWDMPKVR